MAADDLRNIMYLREMVEAFEKKALEYYRAAPDDADQKLERLKVIRATLIKDAAPDELSIAAMSPMYIECPPGMRCVGGVCVDGNGVLRDEDFPPDFGFNG